VTARPLTTALSVIVPARDAADTIADTLDSLLGQTRIDWEAIIVDDGSIDSTRQVAETFAGRDPRFRLLSDGRPAEGVAAARNRGIAEARGQWLHFLDADDWIEAAFVEKMLGALEARPGRKLAYGSSCNIAVDGARSAPWFSEKVAHAPFETLACECPLVVHTVVIDKALVRELGGFDASMSTGEDADFWQRVARTGTGFFPVPEALVFYRARRHSLSTGAHRRLAVGRTVISRGFEPDPRVPNPDPRYAAGAAGGSREARDIALAYFALWCAAFDVGEGGDGKGMVTSLPDCPGGAFDECRAQILSGLAAGMRLPTIGASFDATPTLLAAVRGLLEEVEQAAQSPGLARLLECALEPELFKTPRLTERLAAGHSLFVREDIGCLQPVAAPRAIEKLQVEFRKGTRCLGRAEVAISGAVSAREMTAIAIDTMSPTDFLRESGLLRRPQFWLRLSIELAKVALCLPGASSRHSPEAMPWPRRLARNIAVGAALEMAGMRVGTTADGAGRFSD
jgi:GT2 family glycosyltransferase